MESHFCLYLLITLNEYHNTDCLQSLMSLCQRDTRRPHNTFIYQQILWLTRRLQYDITAIISSPQIMDVICWMLLCILCFLHFNNTVPSNNPPEESCTMQHRYPLLCCGLCFLGSGKGTIGPRMNCLEIKSDHVCSCGLAFTKNYFSTSWQFIWNIYE